MAAPDHVNRDQMRYMTGAEIQDLITDSIDRNPIGGFGGTMEKMWKGKLRGSKRDDRIGPGTGSGVYASLLEHGWIHNEEEGPVDIMHVRKYGAIPEWDRDEYTLSGFHHRIAAAADMERRGKRTINIPVRMWSYPSIVPEHRRGSA